MRQEKPVPMFILAPDYYFKGDWNIVNLSIEGNSSVIFILWYTITRHRSTAVSRRESKHSNDQTQHVWRGSLKNKIF